MIIREFQKADTKGFLECHYSAVHISAGQDYPKDILDQWSPVVNDDRINKFLQKDMEGFVRYVADENGLIVGLGEYAPEQNLLGACYVHADYAGQGIGQALMKHIEADAVNKGVKYLEMDSSVTAMPFYKKMGYQVLKVGEHLLSSGQKMKCYKMRKNL